MRISPLVVFGLQLSVTASMAQAQVITPRVPGAVDYRMRVAPGGALEVTTGGTAFLVDSLFSEPRETKGVWNLFGDASQASPAWSVRIDRESGETIRATGVGRLYRIERTYARKSDHIEVTDTITVTHTAPIGISIRHRVHLEGSRVTEIRLGGYEVSEGRGRCGLGNLGNPTLFVKSDAAGVGLLPLDDVFRAQAVLRNEAVAGPASCRVSSPPAVELTDPNFGENGGRAYTLRWAVYPVPEEWSYFTFINVVRRNLDANITIDGSAIFFYPHSVFFNRAGFPGDWRKWEPAALRDFLGSQGIRYVISGIPEKPDRTLAHGSAFVHELGPASEQFLKDLVHKVHEAAPGVKVLVYMHPFISSETGASTRYSGDRILDESGAQLVYAGRDPYLLFYGTLTNGYGRELDKYVDKVMQVLGADGIYMDEASWSVAKFNYDGNWDGFTVEIDPLTFELRRRIASIPLITLAERVALVERVKRLGGVMIANTPPLTESFARERITHFTETGDLTHLYRTHLDCPLGLDVQPKSQDTGEAAGVARDLVGHLDYGALFYFYGVPYPRGIEPNPMQQMYPLTPIEIESGYVIGAERIVTKVSGTFGWNTGDALRVHVYDATGRQRAESTVPAAAGATAASVSLKPGEIAIIVREPSRP